jgi:hypothetical protein
VEADQRFVDQQRPPGWLNFTDDDAAQMEIEERRRRRAAKLAWRRKAHAAAPKPERVYDISSDEGTDSEDDGRGGGARAGARAGAGGRRRQSGSAASVDASDGDGDGDGDEAKAVDPETLRLCSEVFEDVLGTAVALAQARMAGQVLALDLARQCDMLLERLQLVPADFPFGPGGGLELRLGMSQDASWAMFRAWEAETVDAEVQNMVIAEAETRKYIEGELLVCTVCCVLCAVCCVLCAVSRVLCAVCCVLCAVCCVLCAVCCVLCAVCCVLCAVCRVPCAVCCVLCAVCCLTRGGCV